jgi:uncharacterized protein with HEPN domain
MTYHYLAHVFYILESIAAIEAYVGADIDAAFADRKTYDAVLHRLETLSASAAKLPDDLKAAHPRIRWQAITGFRNILAHDYLGDIDHAVLIGIIRERLPELANALRQHVPDSFQHSPYTPS